MVLAPGLSRKLKKVLDTPTNRPDLLSSLSILSEFYEENSPQARHNIRSIIDKHSLSINHEFLLASDDAQQALDCVEEDLNALAECCDKIEKALSSCNAITGDLLISTERLKQELEVPIQKQEILSCFLRDCQLSNEEIYALKEEELDENFFKALAHVQEIHANCKLLLRTHHHHASLELMEKMAVYQRGAYERLYRWVQAEYRRLSDTDNPEVGELLRTAVRCLKERPVLFKDCAEEVANMRHKAIFGRFISALTRGGPGGMPRPIEVHAYDPLRYVGDMLGWLHQALASEKELVLALLDPDKMVDSIPTARQSSKGLEGDLGKTETDLTFFLDWIFKGVSSPLKVRVEQILQSQLNIIISYKLSNTLEFYSRTISYLLGKETSICNTLWSLKDAAKKKFVDTVKTRVEKLLQYPQLVAVDLSPPVAIREGVYFLLEIIETSDSMTVTASGNKPFLDSVISAILDPIIQMCEQAAEGSIHSSRRSRTGSDPSQCRRSSLDITARHSSSISTSQTSETPSNIFLINCMSAIQQPLLRYEIASEYVERLGTKIQNQLNSLVDEEVNAILNRCSLSNKMAYFRSSSNTNTMPLAEIEDTSPSALSECLRVFYGLILGGECPLPEFEQIQVLKLRSEACVRVARSLGDAYETIYTAVMDPKNQYPNPKSLVRHPPDLIRTILGI